MIILTILSIFPYFYFYPVKYYSYHHGLKIIRLIYTYIFAVLCLDALRAVTEKYTWTASKRHVTQAENKHITHAQDT